MEKLSDNNDINQATLYRTIFEYTGNATILIAEDTTILLANTNFAQLAGYSRNEIEGKMSWTSFIFPEDLDRMKKHHARRREENDSTADRYEFRFVTRQGEIHDIFLTVALIAGTKESVASCMDITERKKAENALKISEERFREMAKLLPESVFETNLTGELTFINESSFSRFGYSPEEVEAGFNVLRVIAPADHQRAFSNIQQVLQGEDHGLVEYTAIKKDGATFPVMVHSTPILKNGNAVGLRGFLIDISDKKIMEDQLLRAQKLEAIGTMAGGIAHDFNNLLMGILGNISLMLINIDPGHQFFNRLKSMEEYVQKGADLTRQLLGFARGGKYEVRPTNLAKFIQKSAEMFGRTRKEIFIHHQMPDNLWYVDVDRGQMDQVMLNLFVNAWQAMPGGGDLYISLENVELEAKTAVGIAAGKYVQITVTDTGTGMDEATQARIFEPFFSTKERGRGTGLGLASVYGIIKNHGGVITVESKKGLGTSFTIRLPASQEKPEEELRQKQQLHLGSETILFIDDEEMILDVGGEILARLGYSVLTASSGKEALVIFETNKDKIDLVILDMIMPDGGGKEVFAALRQFDPNVKVLLASGYSLDSQAKNIMDEGCQGFIQKPFTIDELSRKIREILVTD